MKDNFHFMIRSNLGTAYCRACGKRMSKLTGVILTGTHNFKRNDGLVLCKHCATKMVNLTDVFLKETE